MSRYVARRLLQMIPIVFGVVVLTFVLFNLLGDPAAVVLGKNASARDLEDYDAQRGLNKPLLLGRWATTRAWPDADFRRGVGPWRGVEGAGHEADRNGTGHIVLAPGTKTAIPLRFGLATNTAYRLSIRCRGAGTDNVALHVATGAAGRELQGATPAQGWSTVRWDFRSGGATARDDLALAVDGGPLHIRAMALRRRTESPFDSQFFFYLGRIARFDLGVSRQTNQKVTTVLREGVLPSLTLTIPIFTGGLLLALLLSLVCACCRDRWPDRVLVVAATALMSVNYIVWVVAGQYVLSYRMGWFPIWGYESWRYLVLPVAIGIVSGLGRDLRFYRTVVLDEMYRDYVRTAVAKGVPTRGVLFRHVLRNALIPVVTNVSMTVPFLFTGSLLLESYFGIPGLGSVSINAINSGDLDVVRAVVLVGALLYVVVNLLADLCYAATDPRVRLG